MSGLVEKTASSVLASVKKDLIAEVLRVCMVSRFGFRVVHVPDC